MAQVDQPALKYDTAVVPRMMVRAMFALVTVILLLVSLARLTDQPLSAIPPESEAVLSRTVFLSIRAIKRRRQGDRCQWQSDRRSFGR